MQCNNCGKEIKEGMDYCMECGAPIEEPAVITLTKEDLKATKNKAEPVATGPFFDLSGFVNSLKSSVSMLLAFIGAILLYLSTFSTWLWDQLFEQKKSANIFDMGNKSGEMYIGKSSFLLLGIIILITGLLMLIISADSYIRPLKSIGNSEAKRTILKCIPIIISIIIFILIWKNNLYEQAYNNIKIQIDFAKSIGSSSNYTGGRGVGPILYICGVALYALSVLFEKKDN